MKIKKILVSQPAPATGKSPYFDIAEKYGAQAIFRPFIKVEGLTAKEFRQQKINIADYTGVIFTSRGAVDHYFRLCEETRFNVPDTMRYFCTMESIAHYLQKYIVYRKRKISFGTTGKLDDPAMLQALLKNKKEKFLFPISDVHQGETEPVLDNAKLNYTQAVMYRTVSNDFTEEEPFDYDMLLFFSPVGIASLMKNFPDFAEKYSECKIGVFGPSVVQAAKEAGLRVDIDAPRPGVPSMTAALEEYLKENQTI